jgi:hypothetical protein
MTEFTQARMNDVSEAQKAAIAQALKDPEYAMRVAQMLSQMDRILAAKARREGKDPGRGPIFGQALRELARIAGHDTATVITVDADTGENVATTAVDATERPIGLSDSDRFCLLMEMDLDNIPPVPCVRATKSEQPSGSTGD